MKKILYSILFLLLPLLVKSQVEKVVISEKKQGKRLTLMAENKTPDSLNVFLMVKSEGYRRSADRPVLTTLPPQSKTPLIVLIELTNVPSSYSYDLIVNDEENKVSMAYNPQIPELEKNIEDKLVLFVKDDCAKCANLIAALLKKRIQHSVIDVNRDEAVNAQFVAFLRRHGGNNLRFPLPTVWNKGKITFGYDNLDVLVNYIEENN